VSDFIALIPARLAATRLPRKPLALVGGVPMVVRVAQQAAKSGASRVVIATDSEEIAQAAASHDVQWVMTREDHASGTDRLAEAADLLGLEKTAVVVNVQGDEPLIDPTLIRLVAQALIERPATPMATTAHPIALHEDLHNPNVVKVVLDASQHALYFSRSLIPYPRATVAGATAVKTNSALRHVGLYAYRAGFLRQYTQLAITELESIEALEQLRVLWHGHKIYVVISPTAPAPGVDTPEDLARVNAWLAAQQA
jgi:3-deoxy-manno-octulosonate cytidylyltransferase (CMP-KDO synthetase)